MIFDWLWWCTPIIVRPWMLKQEDLRVQGCNEPKASLENFGKIMSPNKIFFGKIKRARDITQWINACLASMRTWAQALMSRQEHTHTHTMDNTQECTLVSTHTYTYKHISQDKI